jgi:hypothetical protein
MKKLRTKNICFAIAASITALAVWGCGGSGTYSPTAVGGGVATPITLTITAPTFSIYPSGTIQLTAVVTGTNNHNVTWSVPNNDQYSISQTGLFSTAPINTGQKPKSTSKLHSFGDSGSFQVLVTCVSQASPQITATQVLTVAVPIVTVTPSNPTIPINGQVQFKATVSYPPGVAGTPPQDVHWSATGQGSQITQAGLYTAGSTAGPFQIQANSLADANISGFATVTVTAPTITITAASMTTYPGGTIQLTAVVTGTTNQNVTWSVPSSDQWTLSSSGLFTGIKIDQQGLKGSVGSVHPFGDATLFVTTTVTAVSQADPQAKATAVITLAQPQINISPANTSIITGQSQQFNAAVVYPIGVQGTLPQAVTWSVGGGGNAGTATISSTGLFQSVTGSTTFNVTATSPTLGIQGNTTIFVNNG